MADFLWALKELHGGGKVRRDHWHPHSSHLKAKIMRDKKGDPHLVICLMLEGQMAAPYDCFSCDLNANDWVSK